MFDTASKHPPTDIVKLQPIAKNDRQRPISVNLRPLGVTALLEDRHA
jgi:hypothetical protein